MLVLVQLALVGSGRELKQIVEMRGIDPRASHMLSERSTT